MVGRLNLRPPLNLIMLIEFFNVYVMIFVLIFIYYGVLKKVSLMLLLPILDHWNDPDMVKIFYLRHIYQFDVIVMI